MDELGKEIRVLLAEDEEKRVKLYVDSLERTGFEVRVVRSAADLTKALEGRTEHYDIILANSFLGNDFMYEQVRELRKKGSLNGEVVIGMSYVNFRGLWRRETGARGFILKSRLFEERERVLGDRVLEIYLENTK